LKVELERMEKAASRVGAARSGAMTTRRPQTASVGSKLGGFGSGGAVSKKRIVPTKEVALKGTKPKRNVSNSPGKSFKPTFNQ